MKRSRKFILGALLISILIMSIGYAAFATSLTVNGTAEIIGEWNVKIKNVEVQSSSVDCDPGTPIFTDTNVYLTAKLAKPGDSITYLITIENAGTINAKLNNFSFTPDDISGSDVISYRTTSPAEQLKAGETTTISVTATYDLSATGLSESKMKSITGIVEYGQL